MDSRRLTQLAGINHTAGAVKLFRTLREEHGLNIPYKILTRGPRKGQIKVLPCSYTKRFKRDVDTIKELLRQNAKRL